MIEQKQSESRFVELAECFQDAVFLKGNFRKNEVIPAREIAKKFAAIGKHGSFLPGENPPDFVFLGKQSQEKWAIEETELHEYVKWSGREMSMHAITQPFVKLCGEINKEAVLKQNYTLEFDPPVNEVKLATLKGQIMEYIQSGKSKKEVFCKRKVAIRVSSDLHQPYRVSCIIAPHHDLTGPDGLDRGDIIKTLEFTLDRILDEKKPKLAKLKGAYHRKILAIWKSYIFAEPRMVGDILSRKNLLPSNPESTGKGAGICLSPHHNLLAFGTLSP